MANFDVIYRIATDLSGLKTGVDETAKATSNIDKRMTSLQGSVASAGKALAGVFAAGAIGSAIVSMTRNVLELSGQILDLRAKTGIATDSLQILKVVAEQNGVSIDTLADASVKLGAKLAEGGKDAKDAVKKLGLEFTALRNQKPEDQLVTLAKAFDGITNPADKAKLALELGLLKILPLLNNEFATQTEAAKRLGIVLSDDTLEAADKFDDQMVVLRASLVKMTAEALTPMLPGLIYLGELFTYIALEGIKLGRAIFDWTVAAFLKAHEVFLGFLTIVADMTDEIPGLGKLLGTAGFSFDNLKAKTKEANDQYKIFVAETRRAAEATDTYKASTSRATPSVLDFTKANDDAAKKAEALNEKYNELARVGLPYYLEGLEKIGIKTSEEGRSKQKEELKKLNEQYVELARVGLPYFLDGLEQVGREVTSLPPKISDLRIALEKNLLGVFQKIPDVLVQALTGGGGISGAIKAIGSMIGTGIGQSINETLATKAAQNIGGALSKFLSSGVGKFVSSAIPVVGSLIGPVLSGLGKLFGFGGPSKTELAFKALQERQKELAKQYAETAKLRDEFVKTAGGLDELQRKAQVAGATLDKVFDASNPEAYKDAVDELNASLQFQDDAMKLLDDTVEKYGFTIEELGPKFGQQRLHEQALALLQDYEILSAAGVDHNAIIARMAPTLQGYVDAALKAGLAIPENLRPVLQSMVDQGLLVDENGEKLTDLSNLTFSQTLEAKFQTIIDKIGDLVEAIERGLNPALLAIPQPPAPWEDWPPPPGVPDYSGGGGDTGSYGAHGGLVRRGMIQYLAGGGMVGAFMPRGADVQPAMLSVGEGVLTAEGIRTLGRLNRGVSASAFNGRAIVEAQQATTAGLAGLRRDLVHLVPTLVERAARHGSQTRARRRV